MLIVWGRGVREHKQRGESHMCECKQVGMKLGGAAHGWRGVSGGQR